MTRRIKRGKGESREKRRCRVEGVEKRSSMSLGVPQREKKKGKKGRQRRVRSVTQKRGNVRRGNRRKKKRIRSGNLGNLGNEGTKKDSRISVKGDVLRGNRVKNLRRRKKESIPRNLTQGIQLLSGGSVETLTTGQSGQSIMERMKKTNSTKRIQGKEVERRKRVGKKNQLKKKQRPRY